MNEFFLAIKEYAFLQNALFAGLMASLSCGVMGSFVVVRRMGFMAGGIAHTVLGGMGAALFFGAEPLFGALAMAVIAALIIGLITLYWQEREDTLIAALWAMGMAAGILFISQTPGYNVELMSYLFGNILMVSKSELAIMLVLDVAVIILVGIFYKQFTAVAFDSEFARLRGIRVTVFYVGLLCLIAVIVVSLIQVVGLILVIALLTLPAAAAGQFTRTLGGMMIMATLLGIMITSSGLYLSYAPDLPVGATIILLAGAVYIFSMLISRGWLYWKVRR